ncbi:MAG TPA: AraC family ligand binding domain-containing protein, partial [Verrucomicrobiae bacterium]
MDIARATKALASNTSPGPAGLRNRPTDSNRQAVLPQKVLASAAATPVLRGLLPVAISLNSNASETCREAPFAGDDILLLYPTRGCGWVELAGQRHAIRPGDLAIIPAQEPRIYGPQPGRPWSFFSVHVTGANLKFFLSYLGATRELPVLRVGEDPRLHGWLLELLELLENDCKTAELIYASQTLAHLLGALICRHREIERHENCPPKGIEESISYMKKHLDEPLRAASLAAVARMSLPHYFALFKEE